MIRLSRRTLLRLAMLGVAAGPLRTGAVTAAELPQARATGLEATLRALLPKGVGIARIGQRYLASAEIEGQSLSRSLRFVQGLGAAGAAQGNVDRDRIAARIRRDFEQDRVAVVDGWILARTEAELCAICVLATAREPDGRETKG